MTDYKLMEQLMLRAPLYSYAEYDLLRLPEVLGRQSFQNAIRLASPVFYTVLEKKGFNLTALSEKEKHTLAKYYNRMCFRPTPFGAFASFTSLDWNRAGEVRLAGEEDATLHLLPDQAVIQRLNKLLYQDPAQILRTNPTLYALGGEYRYIRTFAGENGAYLYSLESIGVLPVHTLILEKLNSQRLNTEQVAVLISAETNCPAEEARDYVDFLVEAQVLCHPAQGTLICSAGQRGRYTDLELRLSGAEPLAEQERTWLDGLPRDRHSSSDSCFYAALERPLISGTPDEPTRRELLTAIDTLGKLSFPQTGSQLEAFIRAFSARYDRRRVPLMEALDPDAGIPYADLSPVYEAEKVHAYRTPASVPASPATLEWDALRRMLFRLWKNSPEPNATIRISQADLDELPPASTTHHAPATLAILFRRTRDHLLIEHAGGATATALAARFSLFSPEVKRLCLSIAEKERNAHPDILFADIGQRSDAHVDNINRHERIYPEEIPLNSYSDLPPEAQLLPADLVLSVRDGELILESLSRQKRVIPRLPSAYNFRKNDLAVYRLLCDLQYQGLNAPRTFDLEQLFPDQNFYPRVCFGRIVLAPAKWKLQAADLSSLQGIHPGGLIAVREFRERHNLPPLISIGREDQQLTLDLTGPEDASLFISCLKGLGKVTLQEYLPPDRSIRQGITPFAGQFLAFLAHSQPIYTSSPGKIVLESGTPERRFSPGSEWLYLKIFCRPDVADQLLGRVIAPLCSRLRYQIRRWFFIRYEEGGPHLRLRFLTRKASTDLILSAIRTQLELTGIEPLLHGYQGDTYERELERYGSDLIEHVEIIFCQGSRLVAEKLSQGQEPGAAFRLAMTGTYHMIRSFYCEPAEAIGFTARLRDSFLKEFGDSPQLRIDLDRNYRARSARVSDWLGQVQPSALRPLLTKLAGLARVKENMTSGRREALLADLIHMQLNRTFSDHQRRQEMVVYYELHKYLTSEQARATKNIANKQS